MASPVKTKLRALLEKKDFEGVVALSREKRNLFRHLVAMTYDKNDVISWRAMEAVGAVAGQLSVDEGRELIQKLLWMLREESGNNAWSAAEILGEVLRANPKPYQDIVSVLVSFHEEEFFRPGVLWAMARIAQRWPELIEPWADVARQYVRDDDAFTSGYAALVLKVLGKPMPEYPKKTDDTEITLYEDGALVTKPLKDIFEMAVEPVS